MYTELGCIFIGFILGVIFEISLEEYYRRKKKK